IVFTYLVPSGVLFPSRRRHTRFSRDWSSDVCSSDLGNVGNLPDVENMDVQYGQAAVLTPSDFAFARDGIAAEADSNEETVLICDLDLDELAEAQAAGTVTPRQDRREDLFKVTTTALRLPARDSDQVGPLGAQRDISTRVPEGE